MYQTSRLKDVEISGSVKHLQTEIVELFSRRPWIHATVMANCNILTQKGLGMISSINRSTTIDGLWTINFSRPHPAGNDYIPNLSSATQPGFVYYTDKQASFINITTTNSSTTSAWVGFNLMIPGNSANGFWGLEPNNTLRIFT